MYIPYGRQAIEEDDIQAVVNVLCSDYLTTGPEVSKFEQAVADYAEAKYAVAVSSGTAALHIACLTAGIQTGDEVITTPLTFAATANSILYCGGKPVFVDINPDTFTIIPEEIERAITPRTKAIIPVHYAGQPCDMDSIIRIADKHGLLIIEDAAHALGSIYKGKKVGGLSDMTEFSFHPVKPITAGEGGIVTTNDERLYEKLKLFRTHGITRNVTPLPQNEGDWYYEQQELGYNYRITDIQCALGLSQLKKLERFLMRREQIAGKYDNAFRNADEIKTPVCNPDCRHGWHLYVIQVNDRKPVFDLLRTKGIGVNVHYIPVYKHPYYQRIGYQDVCCPNAEKFYKNAITLPIYPGLTSDEQDCVIEAVLDAVERGK